MHFKTLFSKTFKSWRRSVGSYVNMGVMFVFLLLLIYLRSIIPVDDKDKHVYDRFNYFTSERDFKVPEPVPEDGRFNPSGTEQNSNDINVRLKNCGKEDGGGKIALVPEGNPITEKLKDAFTKSDYEVSFFDSSEDIDKFTSQIDYTSGDDAMEERICFGIVIDEFEQQKYSYRLRYNLTAPDHIDDHYDPSNENKKLAFMIDSEPMTEKIRDAGVLTVQFLIEGIILEHATGKTLNGDAGAQKMTTPEYRQADFASLETLFMIVFIMAGVSAMLQVVGMIVVEREKRIIENMESMGMSKFEYLLSIILFQFLIHFLQGIIISAIVSAAILKSLPFILVFLIYIVFVYNFIMIGVMVSAFFINSKKAIVSGLLVFFVLYIPWSVRDSLNTLGTGATTVMALSPVGALSQLILNVIEHENVFFDFNFSALSVEVLNFKARTYFIIGIIEIIIFFFLGIYLFYVVPLSIGIAKHPLFFLGYPRKKKKNRVHKLTKTESQVLREQNDFEQVEEELLAQRNENKTLQINDLIKVFGNGKLAVDHLNIEMFSNQIFSLLGHNGAGKTTTLSMISGFYNKTSGNISIFGLDSTEDKRQVQKLMGFCPQTNPIFDFLTVKEHLILYAKIKGVHEKINEEIDSLLTDLDLLPKKNYQARFLSGGQKRKLCVAMAFIGGSKIILLDEPTSGMDTYARRLLWEMIKKYKQDRLIILTTHNMDEADYLGDRIGIMSEGKMITCGSSLYLKNKFGVGYDLIIVKEQNIDERQTDKIVKEIQSMIPEAIFKSDIGTELKIRLPSGASEKFADLFEMLENDKDKLKIENFGIGLTTLEEVFLSVGGNKDEEEERASLQDNSIDEPLIENRRKDNEFQTDPAIEDKDLEMLRLQSNSKIFALQAKALIKKRFIYFRRDKVSLCCEILLPIIIILIGLALSKIEFVKNSPSLVVSPSIYDGVISVNKYPGIDQPGDIGDEFSGGTSTIREIDAASRDLFSEEIFDKRLEEQTGAYFIDSFNDNSYKYTMFYNITAPYAPFIGVNSINNGLLRHYTKNEDAYINITFEGLKVTEGEKSIEGTIDGFVSVFLIGLAFAFLPASLIAYVVRERELNAKHQQMISGAGYFVYWMVNLLVDYVKYLIPALVAFILIYAFEMDFLTKDDRGAMTFLLFFFFGFSMLTFVYLVAFMFKSPSSAQIFIFLWSMLSVMILVTVSFVLTLIESTRDVNEVLKYFFRLNPFFSFSYGLLALSNLELFSFVRGWLPFPGPFTAKIALLELLYLIFTTLLFLFCIFLIENFHKIFLRRKKTIDKRGHMLPDDEEDREGDDVLAEERNVMKNPENYTVRFNNMEKAYSIGTCGRQTKVAVKGITIGAEQGSVFGLLGTNGAGKTSAFKVLTGDTYPTNGSAFIMNKEMPFEINGIREFIGYCPQFDTIIPNMTAEEHLRLYVSLKGVDPKYHDYLIEQAISTLNLKNYRHVQAGTYSGGNKRKLSVAIAMIGKPPIILLDEPSSGMDPKARRFMWSVINDLSVLRRHSTIILTTHSMEEAEALATKLAIMVDGQIKTIGSVQQLKNRYGKVFEIEIKIVLLNRHEIQDQIGMLMEKNNFKNHDKLKRDDIDKVLDDLGEDWLKNEIAPEGKGKKIHSALTTMKYVSLSILLEWIDIVKKFGQIERQFGQEFHYEVLESFQSFSKYKVDASARLSKIFKFLETNKTDLQIENYSVKQISLEQIFIKFAEKVEH